VSGVVVAGTVVEGGIVGTVEAGGRAVVAVAAVVALPRLPVPHAATVRSAMTVATKGR
jgi:hypothetical protein